MLVEGIDEIEFRLVEKVEEGRRENSRKKYLSFFGRIDKKH
jgi:hypothetical protein